MTLNVTQHIEAAYKLAASENWDTQMRWRFASHFIQPKLPDSPVGISIGEIGRLDSLLRSMEHELKLFSDDETTPFSPHNQFFLSELWVCKLYEILRVLKSRQVEELTNTFSNLFHDPTLIRIALDKFEIARYQNRKDEKLLAIDEYLGDTDIIVDKYKYNKDDPQRVYKMPSTMSKCRSVVWSVADRKNQCVRSIERQRISDRILDYWAPVDST